MVNYKITNITNTAGKRDFKYNSSLDIEYVDEMTKKSITVKPGDSIYLTVHTLPLSVHRLRVKNLITVSEVSEKELADIVSEATVKPKKKAVVNEDDEQEKIEEASKKSSAKRKAFKKENEE
jgi:hypothetical protein